jgi:hypothetical protein
VDGICSADEENRNCIEQFGKLRGKRPVDGSSVNGSLFFVKMDFPNVFTFLRATRLSIRLIKSYSL